MFEVKVNDTTKANNTEICLTASHIPLLRTLLTFFQTFLQFPF